MTKIMRVCAVALAALMGAARAAAQTSPLTPSCPAGASPVIDTSEALVGLAPAAVFTGRPFPAEQRRQALLYAAAMRKLFVAPTSGGPVPMLSSVEPAGFAKPARGPLSASAAIILKPDGRLLRLESRYMPIGEPLASALMQAARAADATNAFADTAATPLLDVVLSLRASERDEDIAEPLMRLRIRAYRGDESPRVLQMETPRYPASARSGEIEGGVEALFVIGSDGKVIPESIRFTSTRGLMFLAPVRDALLAAQFRAGQSGGCAVPTTVRQGFQFKMEQP